MQGNNKVQWVYSAASNEELSQRYDQWARDYDSDLERDFGYLGPQIACRYFEKYIPRDARILDAGAGTGQVGRILSELGYRNLTAMDLSVGMLEQARKKNVYQELYQMEMGKALGFDSDSFDAVISVGTLTLGHAPASSLEELVRITRPGGEIVFTLRPDIYQNAGFKEKQDELEAAKKWKLVEKSEKYQIMPKGEPDVFHEVWIYRVI